MRIGGSRDTEKAQQETSTPHSRQRASHLWASLRAEEPRLIRIPATSVDVRIRPVLATGAMTALLVLALVLSALILSLNGRAIAGQAQASQLDLAANAIKLNAKANGNGSALDDGHDKDAMPHWSTGVSTLRVGYGAAAVDLSASLGAPTVAIKVEVSCRGEEQVAAYIDGRRLGGPQCVGSDHDGWLVSTYSETRDYSVGDQTIRIRVAGEEPRTAIAVRASIKIICPPHGVPCHVGW